MSHAAGVRKLQRKLALTRNHGDKVEWCSGHSSLRRPIVTLLQVSHVAGSMKGGRGRHHLRLLLIEELLKYGTHNFSLELPTLHQ